MMKPNTLENQENKPYLCSPKDAGIQLHSLRELLSRVHRPQLVSWAVTVLISRYWSTVIAFPPRPILCLCVWWSKKRFSFALLRLDDDETRIAHTNLSQRFHQIPNPALRICLRATSMNVEECYSLACTGTPT